MIDLRRWCGVLALLALAVGCQSSAQSINPGNPTQIPSSTPAPTAPKTVKLTSTPTLTETPLPPTPAPTETIATPAPPPTDACTIPHGQLIVSDLDSKVLARRVPYSIYLPPCYASTPTRLYPVLYLLHGANADNTQWPDLNVAPDADALIARGSILPLVVVMPDGNYRPGEDYAAFVLQDLMPHIEQTRHIAPEPSAHAIGGLSMGGYWALEIAFAHPELFAAVGGHSPATNSTLTDLAAKNSGELKKLRIYLDVGQDDSLEPGVTDFNATLEEQGLKPIFHVYPGTHTRPYWRAHTSEYLLFYTASWLK